MQQIIWHGNYPIIKESYTILANKQAITHTSVADYNWDNLNGYFWMKRTKFNY